MEFMKPIPSPAFRRKMQENRDAMDLRMVMFDTSLSYSAHHHKKKAEEEKKVHGPAAMTAKNSARRKQVK